MDHFFLETFFDDCGVFFEAGAALAAFFAGFACGAPIAFVTSFTSRAVSTSPIGLKTLPPSAPAKCRPTARPVASSRTSEPESPGFV